MNRHIIYFNEIRYAESSLSRSWINYFSS